MISLLLALVLSLGLCACGGTGNKTHDYILTLLEDGEYDMAIHVIEGLKATAPAEETEQPEVQQNAQTEERAPEQAGPPTEFHVELAPEVNGDSWRFVTELFNDTEEPITLMWLNVIDRFHGIQTADYMHEGTDLNPLLYNLTLQPGETMVWSDNHPIVSSFNEREYAFCFRAESGKQVMVIFTFNMVETDETQTPSDAWTFACVLENTGETELRLYAMDATDLLNGQKLGTRIFDGIEALMQLGLDGFVLQPGQSDTWTETAIPSQEFNGREYRFHFMDGEGNRSTQTCRIEGMELPAQAAYAEDAGKDLRTLRHDADFSEEVFDGVFWVPANTLGESRYTNAEIYAMLQESPEQKREKIATLYEALQLYQVGNFTSSDDNIRIEENGLFWEHHKPGYHAVRTNTGCCATDTNWLRYILDGDYEEVGFIATSQRDGGGHVYNYILQDGWYYMIDLTHYHASGGPMATAVEDGTMDSYFATDRILGNIHKTQSIASYVDYVQQTFNDPPGLMFRYTAENVLAVDSVRSDSGVQIVYETANGQPIEVIFDDPADALTVVRETSPVNIPDWSKLPGASFPG